MNNRTTAVTKTGKTLINDILTNTFARFQSFSAIIKTDINNHFPNRFILKRIDWDLMKQNNSANTGMQHFSSSFYKGI